VKEHGGEIWAENRDGGGAVFSFRLPVTPADGSAPERPDAKPADDNAEGLGG